MRLKVAERAMMLSLGMHREWDSVWKQQQENVEATII